MKKLFKKIPLLVKIYYIIVTISFSSYFSNILGEKLNDIPKITFDQSLLEYDGGFTEQSLPKFLAQAYHEKKLNDENFRNETCLKAKKMNAQGSFNTLQLFLVTATCRSGPASMYIVKEAKNGLAEATSLKAIEKYPGMKELLAPKIPPKGLPSIALPLAYFSYSGANGYGVHYIAAMPAAKGKVLCELVNEFRNNQSKQNAERIKRAYKILGTEMANFHKRFMKPIQNAKIGKTIPHGDFHCFNVFYDEIGGHFTFIDNESMAASLKNLITPDDDILKLFLGLFSASEPAERKDIIKGVDLKVWHDLAFKNFIEGYLDAYKSTEQQQVLSDLKNMFNSNASFPWLKINSSELQELRLSYINPVFDEIQKQRFV
ncbi:MAG TPA: hypothetical protein VLB80_01520 [Candidatus Babeliales bacterium]|nr:hypothetical protein [Candidatus Babeliales bacterium]